MQIEPYTPNHLDGVVRLSLCAWAPVFASIQNAMDPAVYQDFYPDWRASQRQAVQEACASADMKVWVAVDSGSPVGFVAAKLHSDSRLGEIHMIAVDPEHQRQGIATALTQCALEWLKDAGMSVAMVETGGDPGHAPARAAYEKAGFGLLPIARYFRKL